MNVSITLGLIIDSTKFISHAIQVGLITFVYNFVCVRSRLCIIGIYYTAFFIPITYTYFTIYVGINYVCRQREVSFNSQVLFSQCLCSS